VLFANIIKLVVRHLWVLDKQYNCDRPIRLSHAEPSCIETVITYTVSPINIPDIFDRNLKTNYQVLIIFGTNISDTICYQMTIYFFTSVCFYTTWGKHNQRNITFLSNAINCLINVTRKNTFCLHFWHFDWHFIQLSIFQLPAAKLLEVFAHCANTGKETISPFTDSSIDKVLLQINAVASWLFKHS